jgi:branched-chain amino acid transport system ATP-binding protein
VGGGGSGAAVHSDSVLEISGLTKAFGAFHAIDGLDLRVRPGAIHGVIGPNGAGKSTLFNVITGHLKPSSGSVCFEGREIGGRSPHEVARSGFARAFQVTNVFPRLSVIENVTCAVLARTRQCLRFGRRVPAAAVDEARDVLASVGLEAIAGAEARTLSHGDQRALEIALALATEPRLLLLDEPTAGMSPWETERMVSLVRTLAQERALTVVLSEHDMTVVWGLSELVTVMHQGRVIVEGPPEVVRQNEQVIEVYLGS